MPLVATIALGFLYLRSLVIYFFLIFPLAIIENVSLLLLISSSILSSIVRIREFKGPSIVVFRDIFINYIKLSSRDVKRERLSGISLILLLSLVLS